MCVLLTGRFYASPGSRKLVPAQSRPTPASGEVSGAALGVPFARLTSDGRLALRCDGADGGELLEASFVPDDAGGEGGGEDGQVRMALACVWGAWPPSSLTHSLPS